MKLFQVDAFASEVFRGNPAAVVPLDAWLPGAQMQAIATENNLAETAFFVPVEAGYHLRWFTPTQEVALCGHATLASAFVVFTELTPSKSAVGFHTQSGLLTVSRTDNLLTMDFPKYALASVEAPAALLSGLELPPRKVFTSLAGSGDAAAEQDYYAIYDTEAEVRALAPDFAALCRLDLQGVVVTAPGDECDFVSRYFAPRVGISEDPVTGSIHCALVPYWAERLGKQALHARQVSRRGGELFCENGPDRVRISGYAVKYLEGELFI